MSSVMDDPRNTDCPHCHKKGLYIDPPSGRVRCKYCKSSNVTPSPHSRIAPLVEEPPSPIPPNVPAADLVHEVYIDAKGMRHTVRIIYVPRDRNIVSSGQFDPNSPWAKFAKARYKEAIERRKRLNRDIIRRAKEKNQILGAFNTEYERQRGPISPVVADRLLQQVRQSARRRKRDKDDN